jgi:hypothetical protein
MCLFWLRGMDLNHRPLGYEPNELPDCSTPHSDSSAGLRGRQTLGQVFLIFRGRNPAWPRRLVINPNLFKFKTSGITNPPQVTNPPRVIRPCAAVPAQAPRPPITKAIR